MSDPFLPPLLDLGLNAPGATRVPIYENTLQHSASVGHTELVKHPDVLAGILQALGAPTARIQLMAATTEVLPPTEVAYYLRVIGPLSVTLSNAVGQTANTLSGTLTTPIPDVTYHGLNDNAHLFVLPMSEPITMTLQSNGEPLEIELTAGTSITPTQAIRYQDLSLPAGSIAMIAITGQGVQPLQADTNGDGVFETTNVPTVNVSGPAAADTEPPMLTVAQSGPLNAMTVTLTATDSGSGVKAVRYSLDGTTYQPYTGPFQVNVLRTPTLYAFADDNVANRSSLLISPLIRSIYVPLVVR